MCKTREPGTRNTGVGSRKQSRHDDKDMLGLLQLKTCHTGHVSTTADKLT